MRVSRGDARPRVTESPALPTDSELPGMDPGGRPRVDTAGEYLGATFLRGGGLAVVTPIQHVGTTREGFTFWKLEAR
jgi:hypothetical protein